MNPELNLKAGIRVVIYGVHSADWMRALDPKAEIWGAIPGVEEVIVVPQGQSKALPPSHNPQLKTVVIPLMEAHALSCPRGNLSLMPTVESVMRFGLKNNFADYMQKNGLSHLCPHHAGSLDDITYPCVVKRVNLCAGIGVALVNSKEELRQLAHQPLWHKQRVVIQEALLEGGEFVTHLVLKNGSILWHATFAFELRESEYIRTPANVVKASRVAAEPHVLKAFEACLAPSNYSGPCNIDYKISDQGVLKILEINPRLGGSLMRPDAADWLTEALTCIIQHAELTSA